MATKNCAENSMLPVQQIQQYLMHAIIIPYSGKISRETNFTKASTHVLHENFARFLFLPMR